MLNELREKTIDAVSKLQGNAEWIEEKDYTCSARWEYHDVDNSSQWGRVSVLVTNFIYRDENYGNTALAFNLSGTSEISITMESPLIVSWGNDCHADKIKSEKAADLIGPILRDMFRNALDNELKDS